MSINEAIRRYAHTVRSDVFSGYEKEFAQRMSSALSKGYAQKLDEPHLVDITEKVINNLRNLTIENHEPYFRLSSRAIFIHGSKSQVKFDYYGEPAQRELGDLIFINSIIYNGRKYFEKLTINQFKRDSTRSKSISWEMDNRKQLYLLSRFPTFWGIKGSFVLRKEYSLPNYSGCLGSYGLLYKPGDFAFVSATDLETFIGTRKSLKMDEIYHLADVDKYMLPSFPFHHRRHLDKLLYLIDRYQADDMVGLSLPQIIFGNYHYACNVFDFAHKYLTMGIGEPIFMPAGRYNSQARNFLHELVSTMGIKAEREGLEDIAKFTDEFFKYSYAADEGSGYKENIEFDSEGRGIGIVHTIVDLGE